MLSNVLFEVPAHLLSDHAAGNVIRFGTILKDAVTGQIAGHMQETGLAHSLLSTVLSGAASPLTLGLDMVNMGTGLYTSVQVSQLKSMVSLLQSLQMATLGVSLVGVGVSVAGFIYMKQRFDRLEGKFADLDQTVRQGFDEQRKSELRKQVSKTSALVRRARAASTRSDWRMEYLEIAAGLSEQAEYFRYELNHLAKSDGKIDADLFSHLVQMQVLCNTVRLDCQMRCEELTHALRMAEEIAGDYQSSFSELTPLSFTIPPDKGLTLIRSLRDISDGAECKPYLIDLLRTRRIGGMEYLEALGSEEKAPLQFLPVT